MFTIMSLLLTGFLSTGCSTKPKTPPPSSNDRSKASGFLGQGNKQFDAGLNGAAENSYRKALDLYGGLNNEAGIVDSLLALSRNSLVLGREKEALSLLDYAETFAASTKDPYLLRLVYNSRAEYLVRKGKYDEALSLCGKGLVPDLPLRSEESSGRYRVRGKIFNRQGKYKEAEESLIKALDIDTELGLQGNIASDYYLLASVYSLSGNYKKAVEMGEKALEMDRKIESMTGIAADLTALALIHEKKGNTDKALSYWHDAYLAWRGIKREAEKKEAANAIYRLSGNKEVFLP